MLIPTRFSGYNGAGHRVYPKKDAPAPDPAMGAAAKDQIALNKQMYADYRSQDMPWMRGIAEEALGISRGNAERAQALSDYQLSSMKRNDERYWDTAVPFENQLLDDVNRFDSAAYKKGLVDEAQATVGESFDRAAQENMRGLQRRGVNPNSGASLAMTNQNAISKATAMASAANKTRQAADQIGLSSKMQMYGGMKGLAGLGATSAGLALSGMGTAQGAAGGMTGAAGSYLGANNAALGAMNSGVSAGISGLGSYTGLQQNAANINAQNDPFNTVLGAAAGVGTSWALGKVK